MSKLRINLPVKIVDEESEFSGESGVIKGHDVDGGYWVWLQGHDGSFYFHSGCIEKDVSENILEIIVYTEFRLPEEIENELEGKEELPALIGTFYTIYRYNLKGEVWGILIDKLSDHKNMTEHIIDYKVQHYA